MTELWRDAGVINVEYRFVDGHHVFTSDEIDGLYVASQDPRKAFDDTRHAIRMLVQLNDGLSIKVEPMLSWREFLAHVRRTGDGEPAPLNLGPQQFAVQLAA
ncbi:MAG: hypothetical protein NBV67_14190 [Tagaea sp.]|nr:hypothetical protein [Tagaea sp.]